jgi:signal transduction histidine kinase
MRPHCVPLAPAGAAKPAFAVVREARLGTLAAYVADFAAGAPDSSPGPFLAARRRALRLQAALGTVSGARREAALSLAGDGLLGLVIDEEVEPGEVDEFVRTVAATVEREGDALALSLFLRSCRAPALGTLPPGLAAQALLKLVTWLSPAVQVSLWTADPGRPLQCELHLGEGVPGRLVRAAARASTGRAPASHPGPHSSVCAVAIERWHVPTAAIVARGKPEHRGRILAFLEEAADALTLALEREALLELNTERERALVGATERRLMRIGFDLHDGALQDVAALGGDLQTVRSRLGAVLDDEIRERVLGCFDDLAARVGEIDGTLRDLARSLESRTLVTQSVAQVLKHEAQAFDRRTGVGVSLQMVGDLDALTDSQKIVIFRVVQEALTNVREHSDAASVAIEVRASDTHTHARIVDDGQGFEVEQTLTRAAREGRLGLVGMAERIRLLGGTFALASRPGRTELTFMLPRWVPLVAKPPAATEAQAVLH